MIRPMESNRIPFVFKCILFPVFLFIMIILLIFFVIMFQGTLQPSLMTAYNESDTGTPQGDAVRAPSIWRGISTVGFILIGLGIIAGCVDFVMSYKETKQPPHGGMY